MLYFKMIFYKSVHYEQSKSVQWADNLILSFCVFNFLKTRFVKNMLT